MSSLALEQISPQEVIGVELRELSQGDVVDGQFEIQRRIFEDRSTVYAGQDLESGQAVAVKFPHIKRIHELGQFVVEDGLTKAFSQRSNNIVPHVSSGAIDTGKGLNPYTINQLMPAGSLHDLLKRSPGEKLSVKDTQNTLIPPLGGLAIMHEAGVVHRDFKPGNIFVFYEGGEPRGLLGDLGLASPEDEDLEHYAKLGIPLSSYEQSRSNPNEVSGTDDFMAPELSKGVSKVDDMKAADAYAVGKTLERVLIGRETEGPVADEDRYATKESPQQARLNSANYDPRLLNKNIPAKLAGLVIGCLDSDPRMRPKVEEARVALADV